MKRIPELDGLRGLAIALVLLWHYVRCQVEGPPASLPGVLWWALSIAWSGVDLFFVLSGFLIVGILLDAKQGESYFKTFYARRASRILPVYFLMVTLFALNQWLHLYDNPYLLDPALPLWSYFTFTQNFVISAPGFPPSLGFGPHWLGVTWSLAVEEQFYLVIPILVHRLPAKKLLIVFVEGILLAPIVRLLLGGIGAYVLPLARADGILLGGVIAMALRDQRTVALLSEHRDILKRVLVFLSIGVFGLTLRLATIGGVFIHSWLALFYGAMLLVVVLPREASQGPAFLRWPWLIWLGTRSYGIYLFHQAVAGVVHLRGGYPVPRLFDAPTAYLTLISLALVFLLAELSFRFIETPFLRLGHRMSYGANRG